ncbi:MAG TPA: tetratricopeptide repeat protein, partial [Tepidisphaeraceae bacterium]|nr:tetratricopeptide repeat protein [Tepidisphaeraceae bacterium]
DLRKLGRKELEEIQDPLERNLLLFEFFSQETNREGLDAAIAELKKIAPEDKRVVGARFQHAIQTNNDAEAEVVLELVAKLNVDDAEGRSARARYAAIKAQRETDPFRRATKLQQAIDAAVELTQSRGAYDSVWVILGQAYQAAGKFDDAISAYTQAINRKPQNREALEGLVRCHYTKKNIPETKKIIDQALAIYPRARNFIEYQISWQVEFGNPRDAIAQREEDLKEAPEDPQAHGNLAGVYRAAADKSADEAEKKSLKQKGWEIARNAVEKFPTNAQLVSLFGDLSLDLNKFADGEKAWLTLAADPEMAKSPIVAQRVAGYYRRGKNIDAAMQYCQKYLETDNAPGVRVYLADLYLANSQLEEAKKQLELAGDEPLALRRRTDLMLGAGQGDEAEKLLLSAITKRPQDTQLLNRLAFIYMSRGKLEDSKAAIQKVLSLAPQDSQAMFFSAMIRAQEGKADEAMQIVNRLRDLEPDNPDIRKLAAELFRQQGNASMATSELESVLKTNPESEETRIQLIETYISVNPQRLTDAQRLVEEGKKLGIKDSARFSHVSARVYFARGDYKQALEDLKEPIRANPSDLAMQDTYFRTLMAANQFDIVVKASTSLLEQIKQPWIYSTRGSAYARLKKINEAMADFEAGYQLANEAGDDFSQENVIRAMFGEVGAEPAAKFLTGRAQDSDLLKIFLAQIYTLTRKFDDAITLVRDVYPRRDQLSEKQRMSFLKLTGAVALSVSPADMQFSRQAYEEYLAKSPNDFQVMNNLACLLLMPGSGASPADAEIWARKAVAEMNKFNRRDALVLDTLGAALTKTAKLDEAILVLKEATTLRDFPDVYVHLGDALLQKGELTEGAAALDRAQLLIDNAKRANSASPGDLELEKVIGELRLRAGSGGN